MRKTIVMTGSVAKSLGEIHNEIKPDFALQQTTSLYHNFANAKKSLSSACWKNKSCKPNRQFLFKTNKLIQALFFIKETRCLLTSAETLKQQILLFSSHLYYQISFLFLIQDKFVALINY